jgi:DUF4097 and DUF4098 domain-containing protein YvlB
MTSYQTFARKDEKSSLLGPEIVRQHPELEGRPIIVEHYHDGARCAYDPEAGYRKRRTGCCARLCRAFVWVVLSVFALIFFLRVANHRLSLPSFWGIGSPVEVPVAITKCPSAPISYKAGELKYGFDVAADSNPNSFYFGQRWVRKPNAEPGASFIQTAGQVIVQAAPFGSTDPISVELDVKLSHNELVEAINIEKESGGLTFESKTFLESFRRMEPCISVVATISVAPSTNISSFDIDTVVLPVELKKSLQLISNNIFIHSTAGSISSETTGLNSRKIEVETTSNTISGSYSLADLLALKTVSGAVNVDIEPKEAGPEEHAGTLLIRTGSGTIEANTITSRIPNRKFTTQVHTVSGSVSGNFLLGASSNIDSASGSINAELYTAGDVANRSCIVNSVSGSIHSTIHDDSYKLGTVRSNFQSRTGKVDVQFPSAWEGHIQAETKTGSIDIAGDGVKIIKDTSAFPGFGKVVIAEKGDGYSNLSTETINGAISVRIG